MSIINQEGQWSCKISTKGQICDDITVARQQDIKQTGEPRLQVETSRCWPRDRRKRRTARRTAQKASRGW